MAIHIRSFMFRLWNAFRLHMTGALSALHRMFWPPNYDLHLGLRGRAFAAALAPLIDGLPRGWVVKRDWLGRAYFFDHLTQQRSYTTPNPRALYAPLESQTMVRMAVLVPSPDLDAPPECLIVPADVLKTIEAKTETLRLSPWMRFWYRKVGIQAESPHIDFFNIAFGEALSYCWGDTQVTETAILNGQRRQITTNLAEALRQFRSDAKGQPMYLWIDAICINQDDAEEKANQIEHMKILYQFAPVVHVWLGPSTAFVECDAYLDSYFGDEDYALLELDRDDLFRIMAEYHGPEELLKEMWALLCLTRVPYWRRKWIIQEVCLAQRLLVHCGARKYHLRRPWSLAVAVRKANHVFVLKSQKLNLLEPRNDLLRKMQQNDFVNVVSLSSRALQAGQRVYDLLRENHPEREEALKSEMSGIIRDLRLNVAREPLDAIYAFLSLFRNTLDLKPNYKESPRAVFATATYRLFLLSGNLDLLQQASVGRNPLPTWAVDFSGIDPPNRVPGTELYHYQASAGSKLSISLFNNTLLQSSGLVVDRVLAVCDTTAFKKVSTTDAKAMHSADKGCYSLWSNFFQEHEDPTTATSKWRVMSEGVYMDLSERNAIRPVKPSDDEDFERELKKYFATSILHYSPLLTIVLRVLRGSTLFVTAGGRFGTISDVADVKKGDSIIILASSRLPLCARANKLSTFACDACQNSTQRIFFHCETCQDILCESCRQQRKLCQDGTHQMTRINMRDRAAGATFVNVDNLPSGTDGTNKETSSPRPAPDTIRDYDLSIMSLLGTCCVDGIMNGDTVRDEALKRVGDASRVDEAFDELILA